MNTERRILQLQVPCGTAAVLDVSRFGDAVCSMTLTDTSPFMSTMEISMLTAVMSMSLMFISTMLFYCIVMIIALRLIWRFSCIRKESILIVQKSLQIGRVTRFGVESDQLFPRSHVHDVLINEGIRMHRVLPYIFFDIGCSDEDSERRMILPFSSLFPSYKDTLLIWKELRVVLYGQVKRNEYLRKQTIYEEEENIHEQRGSIP